jgi:hypothetical protein
MRNVKFKNWLESTDIFGFDKEIRKSEFTQEKDTPIKRFDLEEMTNYLAEMPLSTRQPYVKFLGEIIWGENVGAVRVKMGTTLQVNIDKLCSDLQGNPTWVTKKFFQINRAGYGGYERNVAQEIFDEIERIDQEQLEAPQKEYRELPNLVVGIANNLRRLAKDIFIFEGIRKVNDENYIIKFGVRGQGVEARDHQKVIENLTDISFDKKTGKIKVFNHNIKTDVGRFDWKLHPVDQKWYFMPTQPREEIIETISTFMKWY